MEQSLELSTDSPAALLVWRSRQTEADEEFLYRLEIALHPDGDTELRHDYDDDWNAVWRREAGVLWSLCERRQAFVDLLPRGRLFVRVTDQELTDEEGARVARRWRGEVIDDDVVLEAIGSSGFSGDRISLGSHPHLEVVHLKAPVDLPVGQGEYWSAAAPAVVVRRVPALQKHDDDFRGIPNLMRFDLTEVSAPAPSRSRAKVHRIEDGNVLLKLYVSENVLSGYASAPLVPEVRQGQDVWVRLLGKTDGRWRAEILKG